MNMLKGALKGSAAYSAHILRIWQPLLGGTHFNDVGRMESWVNFSGKDATQIFNPRRGRGLNLGPSGWKADILPWRISDTSRSRDMSQNHTRPPPRRNGNCAAVVLACWHVGLYWQCNWSTYQSNFRHLIASALSSPPHARSCETSDRPFHSQKWSISNFPLHPHQKYIISHSMKNLAFHSSLMIILAILTIPLIPISLEKVRRMWRAYPGNRVARGLSEDAILIAFQYNC